MSVKTSVTVPRGCSTIVPVGTIAAQPPLRKGVTVVGSLDTPHHRA
jgi:hypothetical protein